MLLNVPPDGNNVCDAYQTFKIATTSGQLTFNGATTQDNTSPAVRNLPTFLANNKFAYAINNFRFLTSITETDGYLSQRRKYIHSGEQRHAGVSDPRLRSPRYNWGLPPSSTDDQGDDFLWAWIPLQVTADSTNHLAVAMFPWYDPPKGSIERPQLASFTVDSQGYPASTNTYKNMPLPDFFPLS